MDDWPAWATEPVTVAPPDPAWTVQAARWRAVLESLLAAWLEGPVEHVGSTAVPGLPAKPTIDLMAPVRSLAAADATDGPLAEAGWQLVPPELDARPWRRFYVLPEGDRRAAHLQLVERGHPRWGDTLAFRDALRADTALAAEYGKLKTDLAARHPDERDAYTAGKAAFVQRVVGGG